jgi:hypothetical protein
MVHGRRGFLKFQCRFHWTLSASTCTYGFAGSVTIVRPFNEGCTFVKMFSAAFQSWSATPPAALTSAVPLAAVGLEITTARLPGRSRFAAAAPRAAIMNNGTRKGEGAFQLPRTHGHLADALLAPKRPGIYGAWYVHRELIRCTPDRHA